MREFGQDYLYKVTVEPVQGYGSWEKRKKPYYVVEMNKEKAEEFVTRWLVSGWKVKGVQLLAKQYSPAMFGSDS